VRSFLDLRGRYPGYQAEGLLTVDFEVPDWKYEEPEEVLTVLDQVVERLSALPAVESVALVNLLPEHILASTDTFRVEGEPVVHGRPVPRAISVAASPGYLRTFDIPLLQGRFFRDTDRRGATPVAVVSRTLADRRFPDRSALGRRIVFRGASREIVGVAEDVVQTLLQKASREGTETVYLPLAQTNPGRVYAVARTSGEPRALAEPLHSGLSAIDPDMILIETKTMKEFAGQYLVAFDAINWLLGGFVGFALILASLGTYGVVAYAVARRRREIGVRAALGARPSKVVAMFAGEGLALSAVGVALGVMALVPLVALIGEVVREQGLQPPRLSFLVGVGVLLLVVTVAASVVPAAKATRVDPARALRTE
jgi:predicted permease